MNAAQTPRRWRTVLFALFSFAAVAGVLGILVYRERDAFATFQWQLDWRAVGVAFGLLLAGLGLAALAWATVMRALGSQLPRTLHLRYYVISHLARRLPGTVWYIAGRGYLYRQHGETVRLVTIASSLEYLLLTVAGAIATLALWSYGLRSLPVVYMVAMAVTIALGLAATHPASVRWALHRAGLVDFPPLHYAQILVLLGMYVLVWLFGGVMFFALTHAIAGTGVEHMLYLVGCWCLVGTLSVVVFFLPSNFGFTEVGLSLLLSAIMPTSLAVLVAVLSRVFVIAFELVAAGAVMGLLALMARRQRRSGATHAPAIQDGSE